MNKVQKRAISLSKELGDDYEAIALRLEKEGFCGRGGKVYEPNTVASMIKKTGYYKPGYGRATASENRSAAVAEDPLLISLLTIIHMKGISAEKKISELKERTKQYGIF